MVAAAALTLLALAARERVADGRDLYHRITNVPHRGALVLLCNALGLTGRGAEVGVHRGAFSKYNLEQWRGEKYFMIDAWGYRANHTDNRGRTSRDKNLIDHEGNMNTARAAVAPYLSSGRAVMMQRYSEAAALEFPDDHFDFIYIDAGHEYWAVTRDLEMWWPKLKRGGMLAGDNFADEHDLAWKKRIPWTVKSAVAHFSARVSSPFLLTYGDRQQTPSEFAEEKGPRLKVPGHDAVALERGFDYPPVFYMFK
jgi:SAM-dependent methyltransferase